MCVKTNRMLQPQIMPFFPTLTTETSLQGHPDSHTLPDPWDLCSNPLGPFLRSLGLQQLPRSGVLFQSPLKYGMQINPRGLKKAGMQ